MEAPATIPDAPSVVIVALTHDLLHKQSIVSLRWAADPLKNVALPVPFGCDLSQVAAEAEKALRALSAETATLRIEHEPI